MRYARTLALLLFAIGLAAAPHAFADDAVTAPTRHVEVEGQRIAWRRIGSGPPIVLVNRLRGTLDTWDPAFLDALARRQTVVTVDYPGVGHSEGALPTDMARVSRFIGAFTDAIGLERFAILGWSWGGLAAQAWLLDHPERVTHAVLLATNPPGQNAVPMQPIFLERAMKPVNDLADEEILFFEPASEESRRQAKASRERIHARAGVVERIPSTPEAFEPYFRAAQGFQADAENRRGRLEKVTVPVLVIAGDNDPSTAGQNWFPLIDAMRSAQFVFFSGTGHAPHHQHPETVAAYIHVFTGARTP